MKRMKENKAITLVALVITIIILLILAGISIAQLTGNGLFEKAKLAKETSKNAQEDEEDKIAKYESEIDKYVEEYSRDINSEISNALVWKDISVDSTNIGVTLPSKYSELLIYVKDNSNNIYYQFYVDKSFSGTLKNGNPMLGGVSYGHYLTININNGRCEITKFNLLKADNTNQQDLISSNNCSLVVKYR